MIKEYGEKNAIQNPSTEDEENISKTPFLLLNPAQFPIITIAAKRGLVRNNGVQQTGTKKKNTVNMFIVVEVELRLHIELTMTPMEETSKAVIIINRVKGIKTRTLITPTAIKITK